MQINENLIHNNKKVLLFFALLLCINVYKKLKFKWKFHFIAELPSLTILRENINILT